MRKEEKAKEYIKSVLFDIVVHELKTNNKDEIDIVLKAITFKTNDKEIVDNIYDQTFDDLDYDRIKDVAYDIIF